LRKKERKEVKSVLISKEKRRPGGIAKKFLREWLSGSIKLEEKKGEEKSPSSPPSSSEEGREERRIVPTPLTGEKP